MLSYYRSVAAAISPLVIILSGVERKRLASLFVILSGVERQRLASLFVILSGVERQRLASLFVILSGVERKRNGVEGSHAAASRPHLRGILLREDDGKGMAPRSDPR